MRCPVRLRHPSRSPSVGTPAPSCVDRQDVLVAFATEGEAVAALRALVTAGVAVVEFAPATGSLEHTFLDLGAVPRPAGPPPGPQPRSAPERPEDRA